MKLYMYTTCTWSHTCTQHNVSTYSFTCTQHIPVHEVLHVYICTHYNGVLHTHNSVKCMTIYIF